VRGMVAAYLSRKARSLAVSFLPASRSHPPTAVLDEVFLVVYESLGDVEGVIRVVFSYEVRRANGGCAAFPHVPDLANL
jgi:hypothetical protein